MAKFHGKIGFLKTVESRRDPGVWIEEITEKSYRGEVLTRSFRSEASEHLNDNITISNRISIVADAFAKENLGYMKYAVLNGFPWEITGIESVYPRVILTLGGVYNQPKKTQHDF